MTEPIWLRLWATLGAGLFLSGMVILGAMDGRSRIGWTCFVSGIATTVHLAYYLTHP